MYFPSVSAATQSYLASPTQQQSKSSSKTDATTQAAASQESAGAASSSGDRYKSSVGVLAALLTSQGATIAPAFVRLDMVAVDGQPGSSGPPNTTSSTGGIVGPALLTASDLASQIMDSLGSNGVLTLASVEKAENGILGAVGDRWRNSNSNADITADFNKLSGGKATMTAAQLTGALQNYMDNQK